MELDPQLKGALITGAGTVTVVSIKFLHSYIQSLRGKIRKLRAEEQTRWEQKVDRLIQDLATCTVAVTELKTQVQELKGLAGLVDKLSRDIQGFHIWKRIKFPEDGSNGGGRNGDVQPT